MFEQVGRESVLQRFAAMLVALGVGAGALVLACGGFAWWWTRVPAVAPASRYAWSVPEPDRVRSGIDHHALHRDLWRERVLAKAADRPAADRAIVGAVGADAGLASIASAILERASADDGLGVAEQVDAWNAALAARGVPWALDSGRAGEVYFKSYYVLARPVATAGDRSAGMIVGLRADALNVVEGWLGVAEELGAATVVADRVAEFAFDGLWPLLDPRSEEPLAPAVRAAIGARLSTADVDVLARTAGARGRTVEARDAILDRRETCGSDFRIRLAWDGLDRLDGLYDWAVRGKDAACPGIRWSEADAIARATLDLRAEAALPAALEALVAYAARHVVVHEARHRLDHEDWGFGTPPPSTTCPLHGRSRIEASAYLAVLGSEEAVVGLVQGCGVLDRVEGGSAVTALAVILDRMGASCDVPPSAELASRARALAVEWFGEDRAAPLGVSGLPERLPFLLSEG